MGIVKNLGLKEKLKLRIQEIHETIGEDSAILDNSEQLNENAMYAIYEHRDKQLDLFDLEPAPSIDLTDAEEMLRQLQQHNPDEFDQIVNLPNGIRTAKLAQETGTFVFCESSNINDSSANRYPQLLLYVAAHSKAFVKTRKDAVQVSFDLVLQFCWQRSILLAKLTTPLTIGNLPDILNLGLYIL